MSLKTSYFFVCIYINVYLITLTKPVKFNSPLDLQTNKYQKGQNFYQFYKKFKDIKIIVFILFYYSN